jgi:hypothetical protein
MNKYWAAVVFFFYLFSCLGSAWMGYKYEYEKCAAHDEAHDLAETKNTVAAEQKVVTVIQKQGTISQEASSDYAKQRAAVDSAYTGPAVVQQPPNPPVNNMPAVCRTPGRTAAPRIQKSKVFGLTSEQCDDEEAKANALWNWAQRQAKAR